MQTENEIVSLSFDRFPGPKGAATHIAAFATALGAFRVAQKPASH